METLYLLDTRGVLTITGDENGEAIRQDIPKEDAEWKEKSQVYAYLRSQGQTPPVPPINSATISAYIQERRNTLNSSSTPFPPIHPCP